MVRAFAHNKYSSLFQGLCLFVFSLWSVDYAEAQNGQWIWMSGDTLPFKPSVYGTQGVTSPLNKPGSRYEPCEWTDKDGNFWLYGGTCIPKNENYGDLWRYSPGTNEWTWVSGDKRINQKPVYGTKGVGSSSNKPGERTYAVPSWTDTSGNLWLMGGNVRFNSRNDLWKYEISKNQWTWVSGDSTVESYGVYGTRGIPDSGNKPGSRYETSCTWVDKNNCLWLFGGMGKASNGNADLGDLWKYDPALKQWAWMAGDTTAFSVAHYGIQGKEDSLNNPGPRSAFTSWIDRQGMLWMYGGGGHEDIWKFNPQTGMWTWINGSNKRDVKGTYTQYCGEDDSESPGGRSECRARWQDDCGNFWFYGGFSYDNGDLWKYNPVKNSWIWVDGSSSMSSKGYYGKKGVATPGARPSGRGGCVGWRNEEGLWIFGGRSNIDGNEYNDLWKYIPQIPELSVHADSGCAPIKVHFSTDTLCADLLTWEWNFDDPESGAENGSSKLVPDHLYRKPGLYQAKLVTSDCWGRRDTIKTEVRITEDPLANAGRDTVVRKGGSVQLHGSGGMHYRWSPADFLNCDTCSDPVASPNRTTWFTLDVENENGCVITDSVMVEVLNCGEVFIPDAFSPNQDDANDALKVQGGCLSGFHLQLFDRWGERIFETSEIEEGWNGKTNGRDADAGVYVYFLRFSQDGKNGEQTKWGMINLIR